MKAVSWRVIFSAVMLCSLAWAARWFSANELASLDAQTQFGWQVVRIAYRNRADLDRLVSRLDVWEVEPDANVLVARVSPEEYGGLLSEGYSVVVDVSRSQASLSSVGSCYRTVSQLYADEDVFASTYPTLTEVITIGTSYEGRPLRVLKLANTKHAVSDRPRLFLMANLHGREFITPEAAMQFARLLLEGYGHDAEATWLLDWHEIYVLVTANPDGHAHNEVNFVYWRKNANPENQAICMQDYLGDGYGTDLNRNSSFGWGGVGASGAPCDSVYRGAGPASDLETLAIQNTVVSLFPDQRGPLITDAAPLTTTGILVSLHSYSNLVLWPWGHTGDLAPNDAQLRQLGIKLASYNGYTPEPASGLYPASGTTDDWSYGTLGIASYTFEIGGASDGFLPACDRYDALIQPNLAALLHAARVAQAPYQLSDGPETVAPTITTGSGMGVISNTAYLTATITAPSGMISAAQAYIDTPPWAAGQPLAMSAADGTFDQATETVGAVLDTSGLALGRHIIFVRGQDALGNWGPVSMMFLDVPPSHWTYLPWIAKP